MTAPPFLPFGITPREDRFPERMDEGFRRAVEQEQLRQLRERVAAEQAPPSGGGGGLADILAFMAHEGAVLPAQMMGEGVLPSLNLMRQGMLDPVGTTGLDPLRFPDVLPGVREGADRAAEAHPNTLGLVRDDMKANLLAGAIFPPLLAGGARRAAGKAAGALRGKIKHAVVLGPDDQIFRGRNHGEALEAAEKAGFGVDDLKHIDLFETADGELIDRFQSSARFDVASAEDAISSGVMDTAPREVTVAYHGTGGRPAFRRFKTSEINTGTKSQAQGHGIYFAEEHGVARSYANFMGGGERRMVGDVPFDDSLVAHRAARRVADNGGDVEAAKRSLQDDLEKRARQFSEDDVEFMAGEHWNRPVLEYLEGGGDVGRFRVEDSGLVYETRITRPKEEFLDWDKPANKQHDAVRSAIREFDLDGLTDAELVDAFLSTQYARLFPDASDVRSARSAMSGGHPDDLSDWVKKSMKDRNSSFHNLLGQDSGGAMYERLAYRVGGYESASRELAGRGVAGTRYLDEGSRMAGEGSRNIVVFDPSDIEVHKINGIPIEDYEKVTGTPLAAIIPFLAMPGGAQPAHEIKGER